MSDKPHNKLSQIDRMIRELPISQINEMYDGNILEIEFFSCFECFNTRPYHNYETWTNGYRVRLPALERSDGGGQRFTVLAEDLDDALDLLLKRLMEAGYYNGFHPDPKKDSRDAGQDKV